VNLKRYVYKMVYYGTIMFIIEKPKQALQIYLVFEEIFRSDGFVSECFTKT
jgi:hypothetical protein